MHLLIFDAGIHTGSFLNRLFIWKVLESSMKNLPIFTVRSVHEQKVQHIDLKVQYQEM